MTKGVIRGVLGAALTLNVRMCTRKGKPADALELMTMPPLGTAALSASPFGGKVEVTLRLAGLEYTAVPGDPGNKKLTPKGKV